MPNKVGAANQQFMDTLSPSAFRYIAPYCASFCVKFLHNQLLITVVKSADFYQHADLWGNYGNGVNII